MLMGRGGRGSLAARLLNSDEPLRSSRNRTKLGERPDSFMEIKNFLELFLVISFPGILSLMELESGCWGLAEWCAVLMCVFSDSIRGMVEDLLMEGRVLRSKEPKRGGKGLMGEVSGEAKAPSSGSMLCSNTSGHFTSIVCRTLVQPSSRRMSAPGGVLAIRQRA